MLKLNKEDSAKKSFSFFTYIIFLSIFVYIVFKLINIHSGNYVTVFNTEEREIKTVVIDAGHVCCIIGLSRENLDYMGFWLVLFLCKHKN